MTGDPKCGGATVWRPGGRGEAVPGDVAVLQDINEGGLDQHQQGTQLQA